MVNFIATELLINCKYFYSQFHSRSRLINYKLINYYKLINFYSNFYSKWIQSFKYFIINIFNTYNTCIKNFYAVNEHFYNNFYNMTGKYFLVS